VAAWGAITGVSQLLPIVGGPSWIVEAVAVVAVVGLPIAGVIAWMFEATPDGIVRTRSGTPSEQPDTRVFGEQGFVRVTWRDAQGQFNERVLTQLFWVGREPNCAVRIEDALVSRKHVEIGPSNGSWYVKDAGSRNGTFLDGRRISEEILPRRCSVRLSEYGPLLELELRATEAPTTALAPPYHD
jgi:hypothetical protein